MTERVDVVVIGLGPAGASAAAAAARAGCSVMAIDRKRLPGQPVQCAELVPALLAAEVDAVAAAAQQPIDAMRTFVETDPPDRQAPFPGWMLDRARFDALLFAQAQAAGARCRFGLPARGIDARDGTVALGDGSRVAARVVIGADGPHSTLGRAMGAVNRALVETRQITVALHEPQQTTDIFLSAAIPGGYGWLFPKRNLANLGAGVARSRRAGLKHIVARLHARLVERGIVGSEVLKMTGGAIPVGGMLPVAGRFGGALGLLAGDAAGLTNPISGAGIAAAVLSGRLAGAAAAAYVAGDAHAPSDYQEELRALFGASLERALRHRHSLDAQWATSSPPDRRALRRTWIAYPEYWAPMPETRMEVVS